MSGTCITKLGFDPDGRGQLNEFIQAPNTGTKGSILFNDAEEKTDEQIRKGRFPKAGIGGGAADAFRHIYWSYRMTQDVGPDAANGSETPTKSPYAGRRRPLDGPVQQQPRPAARPRPREQGAVRRGRGPGGNKKRPRADPAVQDTIYAGTRNPVAEEITFQALINDRRRPRMSTIPLTGIPPAGNGRTTTAAPDAMNEGVAHQGFDPRH